MPKRKAEISEANVISEETKIEVPQIFDSDELNAATAKIHILIHEAAQYERQAKENAALAFIRRFRIGKLVHDNLEQIIQECGSQGEFARRIGITEAMVSNNRRGYEALLEFGCNNEDDVLQMLSSKKIDPTSRNFEKIKSLLILANSDQEEDEDDRPKSRKERHQRALEAASSEVDRVRRQVIGDIDADDVVADNTSHVFEEDINSMKSAIATMKVKIEKLKNPERIDFRSSTYLDYIRNIKFDLVADHPVEKVDPHHANEFEDAGLGTKVSDLCCIPVSRETHQLLESGVCEYTETELLRMQRNLLMMYVMTLHKELGIK